VARGGLEVADIFRHFGPAFRDRHGVSLSSAQRRAMTAIETCRTAALGGHVEQCSDCGHQRIAFNSCRNRNCPKCQGLARVQWLQDRQAELLDVPYFHVVFTVPAEIEVIAFQNQTVMYDILFRAASETLRTIAADPKHLGAEICFLAVLHTWGQALTHHPHLHVLVPGGGIAPDGNSWISCRPGFFLPIRVLSRLFRGLFLHYLDKAFTAGALSFFSAHRHLQEPAAFRRYLTPVHNTEWVIYAKRPFAGPAQVLEYVGRYTHRVAISNNRLVSMNDGKVCFRWKDYRDDNRQKTMLLPADEFIRRFLIHVLPGGFHRIRHYGLFANGGRADNIARARQLLNVPATQNEPSDADSFGDSQPHSLSQPCPCCGGRMIIVETFERGCAPRQRPTVAIRIDSS
jgi:hypothetical protein